MKVLGKEIDFKIVGQTTEQFMQRPLEKTEESDWYSVIILDICIRLRCRRTQGVTEFYLRLGNMQTRYSLTREALDDPWVIDNLDYMILGALFNDDIAKLLADQLK